MATAFAFALAEFTYTGKDGGKRKLNIKWKNRMPETWNDSEPYFKLLEIELFMMEFEIIESGLCLINLLRSNRKIWIQKIFCGVLMVFKCLAKASGQMCLENILNLKIKDEGVYFSESCRLKTCNFLKNTLLRLRFYEDFL